MRGLSLALRFALSIYMARDLGLYAVGIFGVLAGLSGFIPSLLGFGISYFVNRDVMHVPRQEAYLLIRDRVILSAAIAAIAWIAGLCALAIGAFDAPEHLTIMAMIVTLEYFCFDLHVALINIGRAVFSNFLLFVRSASWIPVLVILGIVVPESRSLQTLLYCWLGALLINIPMHFLILRDTDLRHFMTTQIDWQGLLNRAKSAPLQYVNDLATNGQVYFDRFIVLNILGVVATGLYTLNFSLTHGIYVLTATATIQTSMPKLIEAHKNGGISGWRNMMIAEGIRATKVSLILAIVATVTALVFLPYAGFTGFSQDISLFSLMMAATLFKPLADLTNGGLYTLHRDRMLATINLAGVVLSVLIGVIATLALGLAGIGIAALATQLLLIAARLWCFKIFARQP